MLLLVPTVSGDGSLRKAAVQPASFAELIKEAAELASQVNALEDEMFENVKHTEQLVSQFNERERKITLAALFVPLFRALAHLHSHPCFLSDLAQIICQLDFQCYACPREPV